MCRLSTAGAVVGALASVLLLTGPALADSQYTSIHKLHTKSIEVTGTGFAYNHVHLPDLIQADVVIQASSINENVNSAFGSGRIKKISVWFELGSGGPAQSVFEWAMNSHAYTKTYPIGKRPLDHNEIRLISVPAAGWDYFVVQRCNALADGLRKSGLSDDEIFRKDRSVEIVVRSAMKMEATGPKGGPNKFAGTPSAIGKIKVICKATSRPNAVPGLAAALAVVNAAKLSLTPKTYKGACPVVIDVVLEFEGGKAGNFDYRLRTSDNRTIGPFKGKTTKQSGGGYGGFASHKLQVPLPKGSHAGAAGGGTLAGLHQNLPASSGKAPGGLTAAPTPVGLHKLGLRVEVLGGSKVKSNMETYIIDCRSQTPPTVARGPGGLAQAGEPNRAPGAVATSQMLPDLKIAKVKKSFKPWELLVQVANNSFLQTKATQLRATYKQGGANKQMVTVTVPAFKPAGSAWVSLTFKAPVAQADTIQIQLDPNNTVKEAKENNNTAVYQP